MLQIQQNRGFFTIFSPKALTLLVLNTILAMALTAEEQTYIEGLYDDLIKSAKRLKTEEDIAFVRKAFELANEAHSKMRRKSGEPYIIHPIAVAKIVASEIGLGRKAIASALLHDVVEDTDYTVADIERMFGPKIASIVEGLTKISTILEPTDCTTCVLSTRCPSTSR